MIWSPKRYALVYVLAAIAGTLLILAIGALIGVAGTGAFLPIIPAMAAAMYEGQRYARAAREAPEGKAMWAAALRMTGMAIGLLMLWLWVQMTLMSPAARAQAIQGILIVLPIYSLIYLPVNRFFYQMAYRSESTRAGR